MNIDDFEIKIQKFDRVKNEVIVNIIVREDIELRGYTTRFTTTRYSSNPIWIVSPPSIKGRNRVYFWVVRIKNPDLWKLLEEKIIEVVKEFTNLS